MRVYIEAMYARPDGRLPLKGELDFGFVDLGHGQGFATPVKIEGVLFRRADVLTLEYKALFTLRLCCDRCLIPVMRDFEMSFSHILTLTEPEAESEAVFCQDGQLDMTALGVDDILPSLPRQTLCDPDCGGLCPECGASLDRDNCGHNKSGDRPDGDPRWAALKNLKIGDEN